MNKLEKETELFKEFVVDEYNQLYNNYMKLEEANAKLHTKIDLLQNKHKDLTALSLKLTNQNELLSNKLECNSYQSKIDILEKRILAMTASHGHLIKENNSLSKNNVKLFEENYELKTMNANQINTNNDLIKFINLIGFDVEEISINYKDLLKKLLSLKYNVQELKKEVKNEVKPDTDKKNNIESLKNILVQGLGKDFHVEVIGGDYNSQNFMRDLFGNLIPEKKSGRNTKRDKLGRFTSPRK